MKSSTKSTKSPAPMDRQMTRRSSGFAFSIHEESERRVHHAAGLQGIGAMYPELQLKTTAVTLQAVVKFKALQQRSQKTHALQVEAAEQAAADRKLSDTSTPSGLVEVSSTNVSLSLRAPNTPRGEPPTAAPSPVLSAPARPSGKTVLQL